MLLFTRADSTSGLAMIVIAVGVAMLRTGPLAALCNHLAVGAVPPEEAGSGASIVQVRPFQGERARSMGRWSAYARSTPALQSLNHLIKLNHVVEQLDAVFHALADGTRRAMVASLADGERSVSELATPHPISLAAVSKHVTVLERAGLLTRRLEGRRRVCRLEPGPLAAATEHLRHYEKFWNTRLDALEVFVAQPEEGP